MFSNNKVILYITFILFISFLTACSQSINSENINKTDNSKQEVSTDLVDKNSSALTQQVNPNMDEVKEALKERINDDIWYRGQYSTYTGFESQKSGIEVYLNPEQPNVVSVYFDNPFQTAYKKMPELKMYYVIEISKDENGYDTGAFGSYSEVKSDIIKERLEERGFVVFYQKSEIEFGEVTQPVFPPMTDERKRIVDDIEKAVVHNLKYNPENKGIFKIFIRNFSDNNKDTPVVIQYPDGKVLVANVEVGFNKEDRYLRVFKPFEVGIDISEYTANQYKKVSFEREFEL